MLFTLLFIVNKKERRSSDNSSSESETKLKHSLSELNK